MAKKAYHVRNWRQYNQALVQRGSITLWFSEDVIKNWHKNDSLNRRGRPRKYSDLAITCGLTLKGVFKLAFRATEGFLKSLIDRLQAEIEMPDYSSLCKRQKTLKIMLPKSKANPGEGVHILFDSTGCKVFGEGEWKVRKHGYTKKRVWRKLHLAVNTKSQEIEAFELTELGIQDGDGMLSLVNKIDKKIEDAIGDGAYDQYKCYLLAKKKGFNLIVPPKRDGKLTKECTGYSSRQKHTPEVLEALKKRDGHIERIREIGRKEWKREVGYHRRSLAETGMFRIKSILGSRLSTRKLEHQKVEAGIWCSIINKMTKVGLPASVRVK